MIAETPGLETQRIAAQLRASYQGPAWHGPSLRELLEGVTPEIAGRRIGDGHSIFDIILHLSFWSYHCRRTIKGDAYPDVDSEASDDWPEPNGSWIGALSEFDREQRALIAAIEDMPIKRLHETISERKGYTFYVLLHGIVQHNLYHAGQIALLKKIDA